MADKGLEDVPESEFSILALLLVCDALVYFTFLPARLNIRMSVVGCLVKDINKSHKPAALQAVNNHANQNQHKSSPTTMRRSTLSMT